MTSEERDRVLRALSGFLNARERSTREVRERLQARGLCTQEQAQAIISHLREQLLLDDSRFARNRALSRLDAGHGPYRIKAELRQLGIDEADAEAAVAECSEDRFQENAVALAEQLLPQAMRRSDSRAVLARRLRSRGFTERQIRSALAALGEAYPHWARRTREEHSRERSEGADS